jgi:acetolactate synthase small subunit
VSTKLIETSALLRKQHEERSQKIKQFINRMEKAIKVDHDTSPITEMEQVIEQDSDQLPVKSVQKRKISTHVKRGKSDLAFLKGNQFS